jgi:hypothetical protein
VDELRKLRQQKQCVHGKAPDAFVFTRPNGKPVRNFRKLWGNACIFASCPGLLFHDLRRTAARNLRRAGVAEGLIMRIGRLENSQRFRALQHHYPGRHQGRNDQAPSFRKGREAATRERFRSRFGSR